MNTNRVPSKSFVEDLEFLRRHTEVAVLEGPAGERVVVAPQWQGKTMTSAVGRENSSGFGWLNHAFISSRRVDIQANLHGGEDRFWIGPEGGQFAFYFDSGRPFDFSFWRCPALVDRQPFEVLEQTGKSIRLQAAGHVRNHRGVDFEMRLEREVQLLDRSAIQNWVAQALPSFSLADDVEMVGHESSNQLWNVGERNWLPETGLPCIWNLGMFRPTPRTVMLVPFSPARTPEDKEPINSGYFGALDGKRLQILTGSGVALFVGDGRYRSKLGVAFERARSCLASWTPEEGRLTLVLFNLPERVTHGYCSNLWQLQDDPWNGDVVNVYNDGPNESGSCLGPFYELETLSPALDLKVGQSYEHRHRTVHFLGGREELEGLAAGLLGVSLDEVERAFS